MKRGLRSATEIT